MSDNGNSWGSMLGAWVRRPFERALHEQEYLRHERLALEMSSQLMEDTVRRVQPEKDGFIPIGVPGESRLLTQDDLQQLRDASFKASLRQPHIVGYLRTLTRFVMGEGPQFSVSVDREGLNDRIMDWWETFKKWNDWDQIEDEIPFRIWRDGEVFIRGFDVTGNQITISSKAMKALRDLRVDTSLVQQAIPQRPDGLLLVRLVPPDEITDPKGRISHGIVTDENDVRTVIGYVWTPDEKEPSEFVPRDEMMHVKINVDLDVKRGRPQTEVLLRLAKQYEDWLKYRIHLNLVRTAVVLHKKVAGATAAQLTNLRDQQAKDLDTTTNDRRVKMLKPGTTIQSNDKIEYDFKTPNLQATDAQKDGRQILLSMAAPTGMPEYIFTADASNANFASTLVAEGPAVREFKHWQDSLTPVFEQIFRWAMVTAAARGQIEGLNEETARDLEVNVEFPPLVSRDELEHTKANMIRFDAGILSKEGWARNDGIDWEAEKERLEQEREEAIEFTPPQLRPGSFGSGDEEGEEGGDDG